MIANHSELRVMLGLSSTITDDERTAIELILAAAEGAVKRHIGYDAEQAQRVEYYPRGGVSGGGGVDGGIWDVNSGHTRAQLSVTASAFQTLQLERIPLRKIVEIRVDESGRFGSGSGAFPNGSEWAEGSDYWAEFERPNLCESGCIFAAGSWPMEPGSVRVTSICGYSRDELAGLAASDGTDEVGAITTAGVDAPPIKRAVLITAVKSFHSWYALKKKSRLGFVPGRIQSEKLGDYAYTLASGSAEIGGLSSSLPGEAAELLEPFVHYGLLRT